MFVWGFIAGMIVGTFLGITIIALMVAAKAGESDVL